MQIDALADHVWARLEKMLPRAYLVGTPPRDYHKYIYVNQRPYDAIMLGILPPGVLLHMPNDIVCTALLENIPVYLWYRQIHHGNTAAPILRRKLVEAERRLVELGVQVIGSERQLITGADARRMLQQNELPPRQARLTPLAKDILEGRIS